MKGKPDAGDGACVGGGDRGGRGAAEGGSVVGRGISCCDDIHGGAQGTRERAVIVVIVVVINIGGVDIAGRKVADAGLRQPRGRTQPPALSIPKRPPGVLARRRAHHGLRRHGALVMHPRRKVEARRGEGPKGRRARRLLLLLLLLRVEECVLRVGMLVVAAWSPCCWRRQERRGRERGGRGSYDGVGVGGPDATVGGCRCPGGLAEAVVPDEAIGQSSRSL